MVVKKQVKKTNGKLEKKSKIEMNKPKIEMKNPKIEENIDSDASYDDMSEEELKKMLGNSDNSDVESDDFSEEEQVQSKEAKVNKKRKLESDDEDEHSTKAKLLKADDDDEEDDDEDFEDDDEDCDDDSFIDDDEDEESQDEENDNINIEKAQQIKIVKEKTQQIKIVKEKTTKLAKSEKIDMEDKVKDENKKKTVENLENDEEFKAMFTDASRVESESLRNEIKERIVKRMKRSFVLVNLPFKFNLTMAKELVPDLVSIIIPYNIHRHQINGNAYIDVSEPEIATKYVKSLAGLKLTNRQLNAFPLTKVDDNVDNYNCTRLALSNLPFKVTAEEIKRVLTKAINIKLMPLNKVDKKMTRIAFAEYACVEDAIYDMDTKHGLDIGGFPLNIKFQSKSNTNIKKSISWDKTMLNVVGINKSISETDMKKLFPQATKINWKVGDQSASVTYTNTADCEVDYANALKNKSSNNMRVFYKCLRHVKGRIPNKPESHKEEKMSNNFKPKEFVKKDAQKKFGNKKFDNKNEKPKFEAKDKKTNFNKTKESDEKNGVKKTNFKPSQKKKFQKKTTVNNENWTSSNRKHNVDHKTVKKEALKTLKIVPIISKDQQIEKNSTTKHSGQIMKKSEDQNSKVIPQKTEAKKTIKVEQRKKQKKDKDMKKNLINKKKQEKKAKRQMKKLQKSKLKIENCH